MEYGIHVHDVSALPEDPRMACGASWREILPDGPLQAIYFGSEFCIDLLPDAARVAQLCRHAARSGIEAVLLTPLVTPPGLQNVRRLLGELTTIGVAPAVVFNDWGVANLLLESFPQLQRRAGRLMNRGLRDPRLMEKANPLDHASENQGRRIRSLLAGLGVTALESDADLEGSYLGDGREGLQRTLHLPYSFAASSRNCLIKAEAALADDQGFTKGLGLSCSGLCSGNWHRIYRSDTNLPLWRSGNTVFFEAPQTIATALITLADRIVLQERPTA